VEELFSLVQRNLTEAGFDHLIASGVVLTGGTSLLPGMTELAEEVFMKPVRIAQPMYDGNLSDIVCNPRYATVVGLLMEARKQKGEIMGATRQRNSVSSASHSSSHAQPTRTNVNDGSEQSVWKKMKEWFVKTF
jgi:cell division protein FtsA